MKGQKPPVFGPKEIKKFEKMGIFQGKNTVILGVTLSNPVKKMLFRGCLIGNNHINFISPSVSPPLFQGLSYATV